jgi:hypothetical protein
VRVRTHVIAGQPQIGEMLQVRYMFDVCNVVVREIEYGQIMQRADALDARQSILCQIEVM